MFNTSVTSDAIRQPKPAVSHLKVDDKGQPYLEGFRCTACNAVFIGARDICSNCLSTELEPQRLANSGRLYNWTIVYRNFPGIQVPFISAIVDLDGGGTVKGNLVDIEPDPVNIKFDMRVKLVSRSVDATDAERNLYYSYFFVPA